MANDTVRSEIWAPAARTDADSPASGTGARTATTARLNALYRHHWADLCRYVSAKFGSGPPEPEDVVQAAFAKFAAVPEPETIANPRAFLYAIVRNIVTDHHRRTQRGQAWARDVAHRESSENLYEISPERVLIGEERMKLLAAALESLPPLQRRLLLLNRFEGLTCHEIGQQVGMSTSAVQKQIERGLALCLKALDQPARSVRKESRD